MRTPVTRTLPFVCFDCRTGEVRRYRHRDRDGHPINTHYADAINPNAILTAGVILESFRVQPPPELAVDGYVEPYFDRMLTW